MTRITKFFGLVFAAAGLTLRLAAEPMQTLDLKPFVGASPIEKMGAEWLVPHGRQVLDGVPFQMDGTILMFGTNTAQKGHPGRTNLTVVSNSLHFERLHLLGGTDTGGPDGIAAGKVRLVYADGTDAVLELRFGEHLRCWQGAWHKEEKALQSADAREVWRGQHSGAAQSDKYLRLFHVALTNPAPEKEVRSVALESARTQYGLLVLAMSVGPANADKLPDTVSAAKSPFPDVRPRTGEPARAEGILKSLDGKPLAGAQVRVMATRDFNTQDRESTTDNPAVGTTVTTDADGHFALPGLPDDRLYRLLAVAEGFDTTVYRGVDPKADPVEIRLKPFAAGKNQGKFAVHARVVGPDGQPVAFASVETQGVEMGGGTRWGGNESFPDQLFTGTNGEFTLARNEPFDRVQVWVKAAGLAQSNAWLNLTNKLQTVELNVGATFRGRVLKDGKPLAGVRVAVSGHERDMMVYAGSFDAKTGTNGEFVLEHLTPNTSWDFFGKMSSFKTNGALPPRLEQSGGAGQSTDLGDLNVIRGKRLAGVVKTRNGEPLPGDLRVSVSYEDVNDSQSVVVDETGKFRFEGFGSQAVSVSVYKPGWRLSGANRSMDMYNPSSLVGQLTEDKEDLVLELEHQNREMNQYFSGNGYLPPQDQARSRPLYGAEESGPPYIVVAGRVVDDKTGEPILNFKVLPGRKPPSRAPPAGQKPLLQQLAEPFKTKTVPWDQQIYWEHSREESVTNGNFLAKYMILTSQPVLRIEAPGYLPLDSEEIIQTATNLVLRLKKGVGANGVVVLPDGKPAEGATLVLGANREQFSMSGTSLGNFGPKRGLMVTGKDGKYSFEPRSEDAIIFVSHPAGWAQQSVSAGGGDDLKLKLKPWASLTGTLVDTNGVPVAGIALKLTMFHDWQKGSAMVNFQQHESTTDAQGHFLFTNVPPTRLELQRMVPMSLPVGARGGMTYTMQTWFVASPGITNDLGKVTLDHPPPEPVLEQIKSKLGLN